MQTSKVICGVMCLVVAFFAGMFSLACPYWVNLPVKIGAVCFTMGLIGVGIALIIKSGSAMPKGMKRLVTVFLLVTIAAPAILDIHIRHERSLLQARAKAFLLRPLPKLLVPDAKGEVGGFFVDTNAGPQNGVLGYSIGLIERYATNGRIRWSARIQGQFACTGDGVNMNYESDEIRHSQEVSNYLAERNAILGEEWNMGFWQWVEDSIEFKQSIPEIEEEDRPASTTRQ